MASRTRSTWASPWACAVTRSCVSGSALGLWIRSLATVSRGRSLVSCARGVWLVLGVLALFVTVR